MACTAEYMPVCAIYYDEDGEEHEREFSNECWFHVAEECEPDLDLEYAYEGECENLSDKDECLKSMVWPDEYDPICAKYYDEYGDERKRQFSNKCWFEAAQVCEDDVYLEVAYYGECENSWMSGKCALGKPSKWLHLI